MVFCQKCLCYLKTIFLFYTSPNWKNPNTVDGKALAGHRAAFSTPLASIGVTVFCRPAVPLRDPLLAADS